MGGRRSRDDSTPVGTASGLSRRGWIVLVSVTAVLAVIGGAAAVTFALPLARWSASPVSTDQAAAPRAPQLNPAPTPRGLPPRATRAPVATVPFRPVASLRAGDCLQTYASKQEDAYPVVDCSAPHIAQLLAKGVLPQTAGTPFPGTQELDAQIGDLCEQQLDWDWVRVWNEDTAIDLRYPDSAERWASGDRSYYCFVYTSSRHELTGSAVAQ